MKTFTVTEMMTLRPCPDYTRARVAKLWGGKESLTLLEFLHLAIPARDKIWVVCQPGVLTSNQMDKWLEKIAARTTTTNAKAHPMAQEWAEKWLSGDDRSVESAWGAAALVANWTTAAGEAEERQAQLADAIAVLTED
jgi:hypothetical protein